MKPVFVAILFSIASGSLKSQSLEQVSFSEGSTLSWFSILTDREVLIRISADGKILEWGLEVQSLRSSNYYAPRLQPYPGRIDYYGPESDSISKGRVRSIGSSVITYYQAFEKEDKIGKIKSIGNLYLDYYDLFDDKILRGKLRYIGNLNLQYYSSFDDPALRGKLKAVGNTTLNYYSSFDDKMIRGKIKSIGPINYSWYTSLETQYGGGLKYGPWRQSIGGVTYILQ